VFSKCFIKTFLAHTLNIFLYYVLFFILIVCVGIVPREYILHVFISNMHGTFSECFEKPCVRTVRDWNVHSIFLECSPYSIFF